MQAIRKKIQLEKGEEQYVFVEGKGTASAVTFAKSYNSNKTNL